jgi:hypothetical protein
MINTQTIYDNIQKNILGGVKVPHRTSKPVIYQEAGNYYLAVFLFFYTKKDIDTGLINRPTIWAIADIKTGDIIKEYWCKEKEFSNGGYDNKYNISSNKNFNTLEKSDNEIFNKLDLVRKSLIENGGFDREEYQRYLISVLANIPVEYHRFYIDLSI